MHMIMKKARSNVGINTRLGKSAKNEFEVDLFKLLRNAVGRGGGDGGGGGGGGFGWQM